MASIEITRARGLAMARSALRHRDLDELLLVLNSSPDARSWLSPQPSDIPSTPILNDAIRLRDDSLVMALLAFGAPIDGPKGHPSALFFSLKRGTPGTLRAILAFGGDASALNEKGQHPLEALFEHVANRPKAWEEDGWAWLKKIRSLLEAGVAKDLMAPSDRCKDALWPRIISRNPPVEAVALLVKAGAPVDHLVSEQTLLLRAIIDGDVADIATLLDLGADPLLKIQHSLRGSESVWAIAARRRPHMPERVLRLLLSRGCELGDTDIFEHAIRAALYLSPVAMSHHALSYLALLLDLGADPSHMIEQPSPGEPFLLSRFTRSGYSQSSPKSRLDSEVLGLLVAAHERSALSKSSTPAASQGSQPPRPRL